MRISIPQNIAPAIPRLLFSTAAASLIALFALNAKALEVTGSFTGFWGQPDQQNQGLIIAVSRLPNGEKTGVIYWAHYDDVGNPSWLFAQGDIEDDMILAEVFRFEGITFMQPADDNANFGEAIGTMDVQFQNCKEGNVEFDTDDSVVGKGEFRIARLSNQPGSVCSGGIGDDFSPVDLPEEFEIALVPTGVIPDASGSAEFKANAGNARFEVEIEDVPAGEFELLVGGESRGLITVDDSGEGSIEFRSPAGESQLLLDFDPRDQIIDVLLDGEVVLTAIAPEKGDFPGNPPAFDMPIQGDLELELELTNEGVFAEGEAEAEFEMSKNRAEFEVEVSNIPTGTYPLFVGGINQGNITVEENEMGETGGDIEFAFPPNGVNPLDFDPRGQTIEILEGATLLFSGIFPEGEPEDDGSNGPGNGNGPPEDAGPPEGAGPPGGDGPPGGGDDDDEDEDDDDDG